MTKFDAWFELQYPQAEYNHPTLRERYLEIKDVAQRAWIESSMIVQDYYNKSGRLTK